MQHASTADVNMCLPWPLWTKWDLITTTNLRDANEVREHSVNKYDTGRIITRYCSGLYKGNSDVRATQHLHHRHRVDYGEEDQEPYLRTLPHANRLAGSTAADLERPFWNTPIQAPVLADSIHTLWQERILKLLGDQLEHSKPWLALWCFSSLRAILQKLLLW